MVGLPPRRRDGQALILEPARDDVMIALEASCGALLALEAARASAAMEGAELRDTRRHIKRAIELLHQAIAELRLAEAEGASMLAAGFVAPSQPGSSKPQPRHPSPRRTA